MLRPDVSAVDFGLRYRAGGPGDVLEDDADLRGDGPVASFLLPPVADVRGSREWGVVRGREALPSTLHATARTF